MNFKFKMSTSVCIFVGLIPSTYPFSKQIRPDVFLELLEFHSNILQLSSIRPTHQYDIVWNLQNLSYKNAHDIFQIFKLNFHISFDRSLFGFFLASKSCERGPSSWGTMK